MFTARVFFVALVIGLTTLPQCSFSKRNCKPCNQNYTRPYNLEIDGIICNSSTILFSYNISKSLATGEPAYVNIRLIDRRGNVDKRMNEEKRMLSGKIVASDLNNVEELSFQVTIGRTRNPIFWRKCCHLDISHCVTTTMGLVSSTVAPTQNLVDTSALTTITRSTTLPSTSRAVSEFEPLFFLFAAPLLLLFVLCIVIVHYKRKGRFFLKLKFDQYKNDCTTQSKNNIALSKFENTFSQKSQEVMKKSKRNVKLLLVFSDDHKNHREVVVNFVKFLQADLGFEVFCELFQTHEVSIDPFHWMENCLKQADKVVVIWSPGAANRWNSSETERVDGCMFTPILKRIRNDLFLDVNNGKYYFGYFDYCNKTCIPEVFSQPRFFHFKLMQEFEELFFRLKGIEMYLPGGVIEEDKVKFHCYPDSSLNKYGEALQKSIASMTAYVVQHPSWHQEEPDLTLHPDILHFSAENDDSEIANCHLAIIPPSPLLRERFKIRHAIDENSNEVDNSFAIVDTHINNPPLKKNVIEAMPRNSYKHDLIDDSTANRSSNPTESASQGIVPMQKPLPKPAINDISCLSETPRLEANKKKIKFADEMSVKSTSDPVCLNNDSGCSTMRSNSVHTPNSVSIAKPMPVENSSPRENCTTNTSVKNKLSSGSEPKSNQSLSVKQSMSYNPQKDISLSFENSKALPTTINHHTDPCVQLAPLDTRSDPMLSLMSLNLLCTHQQTQ